jgi:hypothetical protein
VRTLMREDSGKIVALRQRIGAWPPEAASDEA